MGPLRRERYIAGVNAAEIAQVLDRIGRLLAFKGENPFKARAYRNAADTLRALDEDLAAVIAEGRLRKLPGIGEAIALKIEQLAATGTTPLWERLKREIPPGVVDLVAVPGLGPRRARAVWETLGIATLEELEEAAADGRLAEVPGLGAKTAAAIAAAVGGVRDYRGRTLAHQARAAAVPVLARLLAHPAVARAEIAGSLRRKVETVRDVDLVVQSAAPDEVLDAFTAWPTVTAVEERAAGRATVRLASGIPADLYVVPPGRWGPALARATGSAAHWERLREAAREAGHSLEGDAFVPRGGRRPARLDDEAELYARLGLAWVPPELREDRGEIAAAAAGTLPRLVERADLRGVVHVHSDWSDGRASIGALAEAAAERGYAWLLVTDHSRSASYAGGLQPRDLPRQRKEIEAVNARALTAPDATGVRVLHGTEMDILGDGSLDYPDSALARLDGVIASVHGRMRLSREEQTARLLRAIANPYVDILGHLTGRLLLRREGYALDMERVLDAAAEHGVAIEINCDPHRMELDWRWHRAAVERGIRLVISPDAHGTDTLDYVDGGVDLARKGGLTAADVLNTRSADDFLAALRRNRA
jgi:DNA polymerase (family 10)